LNIGAGAASAANPPGDRHVTLSLFLPFDSFGEWIAMCLFVRLAGAGEAEEIRALQLCKMPTALDCFAEPIVGLRYARNPRRNRLLPKRSWIAGGAVFRD